ncbi:unnamed protein product [Ceutorhynchus assimilis]|uniref:CCHC-type domain-containing protein n=1 Tax=Ceutorhynchus assimilis TaxID=467358 RepID=A0A9N9QKR1_9CUCU|nr:unnamed protein product [Ceutorhynchus assimilis]
MASPPGGEGTSAQTQINSSEKAVETMDGDFGDISTDKTQTKKCFNTFTDKYNLSCIYVMIENTSKENFGRVHPLRVGHILHKKLMIQNIIEVKPVGKNRVRVQLKSLKDANLLINNVALEKENLRAFIPNHLLETKGLIRGVDTFFEESYILQNINSSSKVTEIKRFTKKVYKEDSSFIVKKQTVLITFEGNILPAEVSIDTVFFPVEMYYGKVTQCFKCLSYGHISKQCNWIEKSVRGTKTMQKDFGGLEQKLSLQVKVTPSYAQIVCETKDKGSRLSLTDKMCDICNNTPSVNEDLDFYVVWLARKLGDMAQEILHFEYFNSDVPANGQNDSKYVQDATNFNAGANLCRRVYGSFGLDEFCSRMIEEDLKTFLIEIPHTPSELAIHESLISVDDRMVTFDNKIKRYDAQEENIVKKIADLEKRMKQDMKILLGVERKADSMIAASKLKLGIRKINTSGAKQQSSLSPSLVNSNALIEISDTPISSSRPSQTIPISDVVIDLSDVPIYSPQEQSENLSSIVSQEGQRWDLSDEEWQTPRRSSAIFLQDSPPSFSHESFGHEGQRWDLGEEEWQIPRRSSSIFLRDSPPHFSDASFSQEGQRWDLGEEEEWQTPQRSSSIFLHDSQPSFSDASFSQEGQRWDLDEEEEEWQTPRRPPSRIIIQDSPPSFSHESFSLEGSHWDLSEE